MTTTDRPTDCFTPVHVHEVNIITRYLHNSSNWTEEDSSLLTSLHVTLAIAISCETVIWSCDSVTRFPSFIVSSANVLGLTILVTLCPTDVVISNWRPFLPMYSSLLQANTDDPLVAQVKITSRPGHAYFPSSNEDVIVWQYDGCSRTAPADYTGKKLIDIAGYYLNQYASIREVISNSSINITTIRLSSLIFSAFVCVARTHAHC